MQESLLQLISLGAILILLFNTIFVLLDIFKISNPLKKIINQYQIILIAVISSGAVLGSILLSTYFKLAPCELCWYQRVFLFSIPIITYISLYKKELQARTYVFVLSIIGAILALYHSFIQLNIFANDSVFCNPSSMVDCSEPAFLYFGFVTVPIISFAVFTLLLILSYAYRRK